MNGALVNPYCIFTRHDDDGEIEEEKELDGLNREEYIKYLNSI